MAPKFDRMFSILRVKNELKNKITSFPFLSINFVVGGTVLISRHDLI